MKNLTECWEVTYDELASYPGLEVMLLVILLSVNTESYRPVALTKGFSFANERPLMSYQN